MADDDGHVQLTEALLGMGLADNLLQKRLIAAFSDHLVDEPTSTDLDVKG